MKNAKSLTPIQNSATRFEKESPEWVQAEPLTVDSQIPLVIRPRSDLVDLVSWAAGRRNTIEGQLVSHRAILFRGFQVKTPADFSGFVEATSSGPLLEYRDRSTPRYEVGQRIYVSTVYPANERIQPHNEGTYWNIWPRKIYFCCLKAASQGGETPIVDVRRVYNRIDREIRELFRDKQVMYVRNYNPGVGLSWQEAFQSADPEVVTSYAAKNGIEVEWIGGVKLRTRQVRPATRNHPITGEELWFNHAAFFHVSSLDPEVRDALLWSYGEEGLPYNTYFGDGTRIDPAMIANIRSAYAQERLVFPWYEGDILLLDNMSIAHAREPYCGERNVIVAMTEGISQQLPKGREL